MSYQWWCGYHGGGKRCATCGGTGRVYSPVNYHCCGCWHNCFCPRGWYATCGPCGGTGRVPCGCHHPAPHIQPFFGTARDDARRARANVV